MGDAMRSYILMAVVIVLWSGAALAQNVQTATWSGGCWYTDYWAETNITKGDKVGPPGYRRYQNLGFVLFCLPA